MLVVSIWILGCSRDITPTEKICIELLASEFCKSEYAIYNMGKLNSQVYTDVSANHNGYEAKAGIKVNFNDTKDLVNESANAFTAFGYGFARPLFREFW